MIDDDDSVFLYIYFLGAGFYCMGIVGLVMMILFMMVMMITLCLVQDCILYVPRAGFYYIGVIMMILCIVQDCVLLTIFPGGWILMHDSGQDDYGYDDGLDYDGGDSGHYQHLPPVGKKVSWFSKWPQNGQSEQLK